jgi:hypothetical protein
MQDPKLDQELAKEAKAIVALAFGSGGKIGYSRITDDEMKAIMQNAVDHVYKFSVMKKTDPARYRNLLKYGNEVARQWDDPAVA